MSGLVITTALSSSIAMYEKVFREGGARDPLLSLCVGVAYMNQASPIKNTHNRRALVILVSWGGEGRVGMWGLCLGERGREVSEIGETRS